MIYAMPKLNCKTIFQAVSLLIFLKVQVGFEDLQVAYDQQYWPQYWSVSANYANLTQLNFKGCWRDRGILLKKKFYRADSLFD